MNDWKPVVGEDAILDGAISVTIAPHEDEVTVRDEGGNTFNVTSKRLRPVPPISDEQEVADIIEDVMLAKGFCPRGDSGAVDFALRAVPAIVAHFNERPTPPCDEALADAVRTLDEGIRRGYFIEEYRAACRTILADVKARWGL